MPIEAVRIGSSLPALVVEVAPGRDSILHFQDGTPVLLLAFANGCAHCHTVAPAWKAVMDSVGDRRWFAISRDPGDVAASFLSTHSLQLPLLSIDPAKGGSVGLSLTMTTPWVYVVDGHGIVRYAGSGWALRQALLVADSLLGVPPVQAPLGGGT